MFMLLFIFFSQYSALEPAKRSPEPGSVGAFLASSFFFIFLASLGCAFTQLSPGAKILGADPALIGIS